MPIVAPEEPVDTGNANVVTFTAELPLYAEALGVPLALKVPMYPVTISRQIGY